MWTDLQAQFKTFMDTLFSFIDELGIDVTNLQIDHAAVRFKKSNDVDQLVKELKPITTKLSEAIVNGRIIYIFKFKNPFKYKNYSIDCIEIPYPASDHDFPKDGWEHVEFVLTSTKPETLDKSFRELFPSLTDDILQKYNYKLSTPKVTGEQLLNTTVALHKSKGLAVKFHCYTIEEVVCAKQ